MNTRANKLLSTVILLMTVVAVDAQTAPEVPRLVVNIMIDQLRTDYMEAFSPLYSGQGFLRLMKQGHMFSQAEYPFDTPDRASAAACLASGTSPYVNGVVGEVWLDRQTLQPVYCVDDKNFAGSQTSDATSPLYLAVSTLGDELKVSTEGRGMVISIAPNRDAAVLSAGHAADAVLWIDDQTGRWCSTTYYGDYPQWATEYEAKSSLSKRIGSITWTPVNESVGNFNYFVSGTAGKPFNHKFSGDRRFREFKASACVNEEVTNFVKQAIKGTTIGMDGVSDLLNVTYYAGNYDHQSVGSYPIEIQDTYVRLDYQIAELINAVENRVGEGKALFVITSSYIVLRDWNQVLYGYVVLFVSSYVVDQVVNSMRQSVQFFIVSDKYEEIGHAIINERHRGCTVIKSEGLYTGREHNMLFVLAKKRESGMIFQIINSIDPNAFVSQSAVIGVYGQGFDHFKVKAKKK